MQKIISIIKDPKVQIAVITGYIAPKILTLIGSKAYRLFSQKREQSRVFVGILLGGTNYNICIGTPVFNRAHKIIDFRLIKQDSGRTADNPQRTMAEITKKILEFIEKDTKIYFVGISSFGPLELDKSRPLYGNITSTPKRGWKNTAVLEYFRTQLNCDNIRI